MVPPKAGVALAAFLRNYFMEAISETLAKSQSFGYLWKLLSPRPEFLDREESCRAYWNTLTLARQRQIYYTLREQKRRGEPIKENPRFAIEDCVPVPTNWNGRNGINEKMKTEKMVIAKYKASYGTYTLQEAQLFEMSEIKPLN